jgi:hypothetical protein
LPGSILDYEATRRPLKENKWQCITYVNRPQNIRIHRIQVRKLYNRARIRSAFAAPTTIPTVPRPFDRTLWLWPPIVATWTAA